MTTSTTQLPEQFLLQIQKEAYIEASPTIVFESMLEQIGPGFERPDGAKIPMKLEAWPGGRWFRDLGDSAGHFWGHVQVIKPPTLLEICGPMFMSYPVISHVQWRITAEGGGSRLNFLHRALGDVAPDHRKGTGLGWDFMLAEIQRRATSKL